MYIILNEGVETLVWNGIEFVSLNSKEKILPQAFETIAEAKKIPGANYHGSRIVEESWLRGRH